MIEKPYWFSTPAMTCLVCVTPGGIVSHHSAVIVRRFWARPVTNLLDWAHGRWGQAVRWEPLEGETHG